MPTEKVCRGRGTPQTSESGQERTHGRKDRQNLSILGDVDRLGRLSTLATTLTTDLLSFFSDPSRFVLPPTRPASTPCYIGKVARA